MVNLDPAIGDEIKKSRPVVVINPGDNKNLKLAIVVPITKWKKHWASNPFFVSLAPNSNNNLSTKSVVDCFQIRTLSHQRFIQKIGKINQESLDSIKKSIALILDIEPEHCDL